MMRCCTSKYFFKKSVVIESLVNKHHNGLGKAKCQPVFQPYSFIREGVHCVYTVTAMMPYTRYEASLSVKTLNGGFYSDPATISFQTKQDGKINQKQADSPMYMKLCRIIINYFSY